MKEDKGLKSKICKYLVVSASMLGMVTSAFAQQLQEGSGWTAGMTVVSTKVVHGVGRMSVIGKPQCVGDSALYLDKPDYVGVKVSIRLHSETSRDGRYWVITEDAKVHELTQEALNVDHTTDAKIVCYKQKFPRVQVSKDQILYDGKVVEKRDGKIYLDGKLMPGQ